MYRDASPEKMLDLELHGVGVVLGFELGPVRTKRKRKSQVSGVIQGIGWRGFRVGGGGGLMVVMLMMTSGFRSAEVMRKARMLTEYRIDSPNVITPRPIIAKPIPNSNPTLTSTAERTAAPCHHRPSYPPTAEPPRPLLVQLRFDPGCRCFVVVPELVWSGRRGWFGIRPSLQKRNSSEN